MTINPSPQPQAIPRPQWTGIAGAGSAAAASAAIVNLGILAIADVCGVIPMDISMPGDGRPLGPAPVAVASVMGVLGGVVLAAVSALITRNSRHWFTVAAVTGGIVSLVPPLSIGQASIGFILVLCSMHAAAGAIAVTVLRRWGWR